MPHCPVTVVQIYRDGVCSLLFHLFFIGRAERAHLVDLSARFFRIYIVRTSSSQCACVTCARFYLGDSQSTRIPFVGERERRARESVHRRRLCDQESARLQRPPRNQLDVVCGTGLYRLGGTFLGLYQVRRVAGESDEDREVRLQALRTKILAQYHWNLW